MRSIYRSCSIPKQVAVAVENAVNYQSVQGRARPPAPVARGDNVVIELKPLFAAITASLRKVIQHEYTILTLYDATSHQLWLHASRARPVLA